MEAVYLADTVMKSLRRRCVQRPRLHGRISSRIAVAQRQDFPDLRRQETDGFAQRPFRITGEPFIDRVSAKQLFSILNDTATSLLNIMLGGALYCLGAAIPPVAVRNLSVIHRASEESIK